MNRKILFVIDNLKIGGAEQVFIDILNLVKGAVNVDILFIIAPAPESYKVPSNIKCIYLNRRNKWSLYSLWRCYTIIKNYDTIHIHMRHTYRYIALVKKIFKLKSKLILHDHYGLIRIDKSIPFKGYLFFKPDIYIGVSEELRIWAINTWKLNPNSAHTLINLPSPRFVDRTSQSTKSNIKKGDLVLVGNIKAVKNQLFALDIAKELGLDITLIGKNQDKKYSCIVSNAVSTQSAIWLQSINDVSEVLSDYKLGIFCSLSESGPLVILEYLLCGIPFLAYKTGGISEVLSRYFPMFFLDTFDKKIWSDRICELNKCGLTIDPSIVIEIINKEFNSEVYRNSLIKMYEN